MMTREQERNYTQAIVQIVEEGGPRKCSDDLWRLGKKLRLLCNRARTNAAWTLKANRIRPKMIGAYRDPVRLTFDSLRLWENEEAAAVVADLVETLTDERSAP